MGDIRRVITLGIGALADIAGFILTGLNPRPYFIVTPANRTYTVHQEDRAHIVPKEDRAYIVPQEDRTLVVTL